MTGITETNTAIRPLPDDLAARYKSWHSTGFETDKALYEDLMANGQHPPAMVISCCDSRIHSMVLMGGRSGDFFIHRNIANLVPPHSAGDETRGTGAALEYAVAALKVRHIIIMGHSHCGGIENGYHRCHGTPGRSLEDTQFIGGWLDLLKPAYDALEDGGSDEDRIADLEKQSVITSLQNLAQYPFVATACADGALSLHGLWHDIATGKLMNYNPATGRFEAV